METGNFWELGRVSDDQLRNGLGVLLASGYRTEARIVAHIAEVEARRLHLRDGCASLFEYCVKQLGLSESEAFHRLTAARVARKFPAVFALLERREIHLTGVCLLRDYLTLENHRELLAEASHKTKLQIQELLARRFPRPDVASYVRKLPDAPRVEPPSVEREDCSTQASPAVEQAAPRLLQAPPAAPARARIEPTGEARYRIQLNASSTLKEKLELFQSLVSHAIPSGDVAEVLERALDLALEQVQKRRFARTDKPRIRQRASAIKNKRSSAHTGAPHPGRREHIPNATQREIAARDNLRCTYVGANGCRCSSRAFLQIHHDQPWARGGGSQPENLRLLCAAHNRLLAERDFGREHVAERIAERHRETMSHSQPGHGSSMSAALLQPPPPALAPPAGAPPSPALP